MFADDQEMLKQGMAMYDALFAWCKSCEKESHHWPSQGVAAKALS